MGPDRERKCAVCATVWTSLLGSDARAQLECRAYVAPTAHEGKRDDKCEDRGSTLAWGGGGWTEPPIFCSSPATPENLNDNLFNGTQGPSNARYRPSTLPRCPAAPR